MSETKLPDSLVRECAIVCGRTGQSMPDLLADWRAVLLENNARAERIRAQAREMRQRLNERTKS